MQEDKRNADTVFFGHYPQNSEEPEPIEWIVLTRDADTIQMISKYSLEIRQYDRPNGHYSAWRSCLLRKWLNSEFLHKAFGPEECMRLFTSDVPFDMSEAKQKCLDPEIRTRDRVFLLNKGEAERFFPTKESRICDLVPFAKKEKGRDRLWSCDVVDGETVYHSKRGGYDYMWWLWTWTHYTMDVVDWDGRFCFYGSEGMLSVRPVVRVWRREPREAQKETLRRCVPGDIVTFGSYPQQNSEPYPIEWQVLSRKGNSLRLISRYVLDAKPWHDTNETVTWENSSLHRWLNGEFIETAFSEEDRRQLEEVYPGFPDKVSLLKPEEFRNIFKTYKESKCPPTANALQHGSILRAYSEGCWWWLRTAGREKFSAAGIDEKGKENRNGRYFGIRGGVRPVISVQVPMD